MIALEIQALSARRDHLLIEIGRVVLACGFTLQRQRLADDSHGVLLTMVVRGPERRRRALAAAMDAQERIISYQIADFVEGVPKPHFAASRTIDYQPDPPATETEAPAQAAPIVAPITAPATATPTLADTSVIDQVELQVELMAFLANAAQPVAPIAAPDEASMVISAAPPSPPTAPAPAPFVETIQIGPDISAVEQLVPGLLNDYPDIFPRLQRFEAAVADAARDASLQLAGQRLGSALFQRDHGASRNLTLADAIERVGLPALGALVDVERHAEQLHIRHSPICRENGASGCAFFIGFLEALLAPAVRGETVSIFSLGCRSFGAGECIVAISA
jgi:hypothetical protein